MSTSNNPVVGPNSISSKISFLYASPVTASMLIMGALAVVQGIYAKYFGLPLTTIASVILLVRLFDAVTDPLIGLCADHYYQRRGSYKPFVLSGAALLLISSYFLYIPVSEQALQVAEAGGEPIIISAGYFLGWYMALYLGATLFEIPHLAWGRELTLDPQARVRIYGWRTVAAYVGLLLFYAVPLMPMIGGGEFTPRTLHWVVILGALLLFVLLPASLYATPAGQRLALPPGPSTAPMAHQLQSYIRELISNRPLVIFILAVVCCLVPISGMWFTLIFIFVDSYLALGGTFAQASTLSIILGLVMVPVWTALAQRFGKQAAIVTSLLFSAAGLGLTGLLSPGSSAALLLIVVMALCYGIGFTALGVLCPPMLSDIIDYSRWKYGRDRAASYFSFYTMMNKVATAGGGALGLAIAGSFGFDPAIEIHSDKAIAGLRLAIAWLPAVLVLFGAVLFARLPLSRRRHSIVCRRLVGDQQANSQTQTLAPQPSTALNVLHTTNPKLRSTKLSAGSP